MSLYTRGPETAFVWMAAFIAKNGTIPTVQQMDQMLEMGFKFCEKVELLETRKREERERANVG